MIPAWLASVLAAAGIATGWAHAWLHYRALRADRDAWKEAARRWEDAARRALGDGNEPAEPPTTWSDAVWPGGLVCAVPMPDRPDGICGMPAESEPCPEHSGGDEAYATPPNGIGGAR